VRILVVEVDMDAELSNHEIIIAVGVAKALEMIVFSVQM
jgi:hypothetical protein